MCKLLRNITCKGSVLGEVGDECFIIENIDVELVKIKILKNDEVVITNADTIKI